MTTDPARLAALDGYDILDTPPEEGFDAVVRLAMLICETPVALVSLVAGDRQWFKARSGFEPCQTDLGSSVCQHALLEPDLLIIPDLTLDPRTCANPLVTGTPGIRFYAGAPLRTDEGHVLGSLCVIDAEARPHGLNPRQTDALRTLGRQVMSHLDLRRALVQRDDLLKAGRLADTRRNALIELGDSLRDGGTAPEMIQAAAGIVGRTLGASRVGFGRLANPTHIDIVADWTAQDEVSIVGRHRFADYGDLLSAFPTGAPLVIEDVVADPRTSSDPAPLLSLGVRSLVNVPVIERGATVALLLVHDRAPRAWSPETLTFLRNVADRLQAGAARARAESEQKLVNEELAHRIKNMMAMIQAITVQTLKSVPERAPVEALYGRILALSAANDVLLKQNWTAAPLDVVAQSALAAFGAGDRLALSGPALELGPRATLSLSLLLHEMSTNAMKYGALSAEAGRIEISWRLDERDGVAELVLDWREIGGPPATQPTGQGFGSRLIKMGLVGTGGVSLRYPSSGLEAEFRAPLDQVKQS